MIDILCDATDDAHYIRTVEHILNGCTHEYKPAGVYVVRVRGWFDHKWLGFAGKIGGAVGVRNRRLTLPPFHPNRVQSQRFFIYSPIDEGYMRSTAWARLHCHQSSHDNLKRYVGRVGRSVALAWFSSDTDASGRGSLMVYVRTPRVTDGWFVDLERKGTE